MTDHPITNCLQDFLQLVDGIWLGLKCLVTFKQTFKQPSEVGGLWIRTASVCTVDSQQLVGYVNAIL